MRDEHPGRVVPVDPPVHVETFASHCSLTWKGKALPRFVAAVRRTDAVPAHPRAVVDTADVGGRERRPLDALEPDTTKYVRVETESWSLAWERRTAPTVSLTGTPPEGVCRRVHRRTTDCENWSDNARRVSRERLACVR